MDKQSCRCCGNPEAYLFDDGRSYCDLCVSNVVADAEYQAQLRDGDGYQGHEDLSGEEIHPEIGYDEWKPLPACPQCGMRTRITVDNRPWNKGNYAEWCPLCGYLDRAAQ
jgi:hypothetical protein